MVAFVRKSLYGMGRGIRRVFTKGPIDTGRWAWYHLYERYRERRLGIESEECSEWENCFDNENYHEYQPLCYSCIDTALEHLEIKPGHDVFVDYGSGKGRIVTVAATYPFAKVIGVEMLPDLNEIARSNIKRAERLSRCPAVEIVQADATRYELPPEATVLFLFNPFLGDVLRAVQNQILKSLESHPRSIQIVYMNPLENPDLFEECAWLNKREELPVGRWDAMRFRIYDHRPADIGKRHGES